MYFLEGAKKLQNGCKAQNFHCLWIRCRGEFSNFVVFSIRGLVAKAGLYFFQICSMEWDKTYRIFVFC